jgi:hypothetical protein
VAAGVMSYIEKPKTRELEEIGLRGWLRVTDRLNLSRIMPA